MDRDRESDLPRLRFSSPRTGEAESFLKREFKLTARKPYSAADADSSAHGTAQHGNAAGQPRPRHQL